MRLPGGVESPSGLDPSFSFKRLDGTIELSVAEVLERPIGWPFQVTALLAATLDTLGGRAAATESIRDLAVGDRQFLLRQLEILLRGDEHWRTENCAHCGERFDFCVRHSALPLKNAGQGFPRIPVQIHARPTPLDFRVPTGRDQEAMDSIAEGEDVRRFLVRRLILDTSISPDELNATDLDAIETAVEAIAPEVATEGAADCPHCSTTARFSVDPGAHIIGAHIDPLLDQIDRIATHYHWSESDILALPRSRRLRYLERIDRHRGVHSASREWGT